MVNKKTAGFTLIEVLVAMAIFAVIASLAYSSLTQVSQTKRILEQQHQRLSEIQIAVAFLERDFLQLAPRAIRNRFGGFEPAMHSDGKKVTFTRTGRRNTLGQTQSTMVRIGYAIKEGALVRKRWPVLDQASNTVAESAVLLKKVSGLAFKFMGPDRKWQQVWPPSKDGAEVPLDSTALPKFIRFDMTIEGFGVVTRILPGVG